MKKRLHYRLKKNERGVAIIEFAVILPFLLLLVMGIIEFGWAFNGWITLTGAAREGARVAVVDKDDGNVEIAVINHSTNFEGSPPQTTVNRDNEEKIEVYVTGYLTPLVGFFRKGDFVINANATMRKEHLN